MDTRPIPGDPAGPMVESMMDIRAGDWWITQSGDVKTGAVETMRVDGSEWQRCVAVELPVRRNHGKKQETLRFFIHPQAALLLAENLAHTSIWLLEHE